jgi:hypothetical protein
VGKPGVGKTTLAWEAARRLGKTAYIFQATLDTRPEDLLITPVVAGEGRIRYVASSLVTAMLKGGVAILDEGNRMSEKSWASLAPSRRAPHDRVHRGGTEVAPTPVSLRDDDERRRVDVRAA